MKKRVIRLTENDLHNIIKESVNNILNEKFIKPNEYQKYVDDGHEELSYDYDGYDDYKTLTDYDDKLGANITKNRKDGMHYYKNNKYLKSLKDYMNKNRQDKRNYDMNKDFNDIENAYDNYKHKRVNGSLDDINKKGEYFKNMYLNK